MPKDIGLDTCFSMVNQINIIIIDIPLEMVMICSQILIRKNVGIEVSKSHEVQYVGSHAG